LERKVEEIQRDSQREGDGVMKTSCEWWLEVVKPWGPRLFNFTQSLQDSGCKFNDPRLSWNSGFEGYCQRALMNAVVARFAHRVQNIPPNQCVSEMFPLLVVFSPVSPSALRSFLAMCFRVGGVLRLLLSVSRSLVWAAYAGLLPSFKRLLRNWGFGWIFLTSHDDLDLSQAP
jgi:hypothetical protein